MSYRGYGTRSLSFWLRAICDSGRLHPGLARAAAGLGALSPLMALANPTGGQVAAGSAHISTPSANTTIIKQSSQNAVINWQQFSVGPDQFVQFLQPDSSAITLNRVIGQNPSSIFGDIRANGQVFLINPNGILFGRGASLDVAGLVASTQGISNSDFMAGRYQFLKGSAAPDASVINQGSITTTPNGYVVLAGDYVENDGILQAQSGRVLLAAGGATTLTLDKAEGLISYSIDGATLAHLAGVRNTGEISAEGGTVIMTADVANALTATAVNNSGFVSARSIQSRDGVIILAAVGGGIDNSGTLDASASQAGVAGGTIIIRGNGVTKLDPTSQINAAGDGATGGFVELSGHNLSVRGSTELGHGGDLLLDPANLKIVTGSGVAFSPSDNVGSGYIKHQLSLGNNVYLVASKSIGKASNVTNITESSTGQPGKLSLRMGTLTVGAGGSLAGTHCVNAGVCGLGTNVKFTKATGGKIDLPGLTIKINGAFEASASHGTVSIGAVTAKTVVIDAPGGTVKLGPVTANSAFPISAATVGGLGAYVNAPSGHVTVAGKIMASHGGVVINGGNVAFGSVSAGGKLSVSAHMPGAATASISVTPGKLLMARSVRLRASGSDGAKIITSAIDAKGGSISIDALANASHATKVSVGSLSAATRVSVQESGGGSGGFITVGNITAGGSVSVRASDANGTGGNVGVGAIIGRTIQLTARAKKGADINVAGTLTATASRGQVNISASDASAAANGGNVNVTGNIDALQGHVNIFTHGGGSLGGNLHVGSIDARGAVVINDSYLGAGSGFVAHTGNITATNGFVSVTMTGHDPQFSAGAIAAHGPSSAKPSFFEAGAVPDGFVAVGLNKTGSAAGASGGVIKVNSFVLSAQSDVSFFVKNGNIKFTGASNVIHAIDKVTLTANSISAAGALSITAHDAGIATASIAVNAASLKAGSVKLVASGSHGGKVTTGNITATGAVTGFPSHSVGGSIDVETVQLVPTVTRRRGTVTTGDLSATGRIEVFGTNISVGGVNAGGEMFLSADGTSARHATVTASKAIVFGAYGSIEAEGPSGSIHVGDVTATNAEVSFFASGAAGHPGKITVGNVTAKNYVAFFANSRSGSVNVGTIKASNSYVSISAAKLTTTGPVTAASYVSFYGGKFTVGGAVTAGAYVQMRGTQINVAGPITAGTQFGVILPGPFHHTPVNTGYVKLFANSAAGRASVNISGSVNGRTDSITANGGAGAAINVGNVTATAGIINISATAPTGTQAASINAGNLIASAGAITATQSGPHGHITLGNITAPLGAVRLVTTDTGSGGNVSMGSATGKTIQVLTTAPRGADIRVNGALKAFGAFSTGGSAGMGIVLSADATGGANSSGGNIRLTNSGSQAVHALAGGVRLLAQGGLDSGGIIQVHGGIVATGNVYISGFNSGSCCGSVSLKNVTGGNSIQLRAGGPGNQLSVGSVHGGSIHVTGAHITMGSVTATKGLSVDAVAGVGSIAKINVASSHALQGRFVSLTATGGSGGSIHVGNVTATGSGGIGIGAQATGLASKTALISAKNITASLGGVLLKAHGNAAKISVGSIHAEYLSGSVFGAGAKFIAKGITATGASSGCSHCEGGSKGYIKLKVAQPAIDAAASISIAGPVKSSHGFVSFSGGGGAAVKVTGNVTAQKSVGITAGDIAVTGSVTATSGSVKLQAALLGGAGGNISAGNIDAGGRVTIHARGAGAAGGNVKVGNISASGGVSIGAQYSGSQTGVFKVQTGSITGEDVLVSMRGRDPVFSAAGITATGPSASRYLGRNLCSGECGTSTGGPHTGFIGVKITPAGASGSINVTGPILSQHGGVIMSASRGAMVTGTITAARNISLFGNSISVGALTAGTAVSIFGNTASAAAHITATGLVKGEKVTVNVNTRTGTSTASAAHGGSIHLTGGASASSIVDITAATQAAVKMNITAGSLHAHKSVTVTQRGASGSITVNGAITTSTGNIIITRQGPGVTTLGSVHAGGRASISAFNSHGGDGGLTINGNVSGKQGVNIFDSASAGAGGNVTVNGAITAQSGGVSIDAFASGAGGNIKVTGAIKASAGAVFINADGGGANGTGGSVHVANVTAANSVRIFGSHNGTNAGGFNVDTGFVKSSHSQVTVEATGLNPHISAAGFSASHNVKVQLLPTNPGSGSIRVTGITKSMHGNVSFDADEGSINVASGVTGKITAANNITIDGGQITLGALSAGGSLRVTAGSNLRAGNLSVVGGISAGFVELTAQDKTGGNVTVSGDIDETTNVRASGSHGIRINAGAASGSGGNISIGGHIVASHFVTLNAHGGGKVGGNIHVGNITVNGSGLSIDASYTGNSPGFTVKTGVLTAGFVNAFMNGHAPLFSAAGIAGKGLSCECSADVTVTLSSISAPHSGSIHLTGAVTATRGGVKLDAGYGALSMGANAIDASGSFGNVRLFGSKLSLANITASGFLEVSAAGRVSHQASITAAPATLWKAERVAITLEGSGITGGKLAIGAVQATGGGTNASSGVINIHDAGSVGSGSVIVATHALTAAKSIAVHITDSVGGSMVLGALQAPSVKVSLTKGSIQVGDITTNANGESISAASGSLTVLTNGNETLNGGVLKATGAMHVHATGSLALNNVSLTDSAFSASAGRNLTVATTGSLNLVGQKAVAGKALTLTAGGALKLGNATVGGSVVNITATSITNSSAAGSLTAGGGTIKATSGNIDLKNETLNLTAGAGPLLSAHGSVNLAAVTASGAGNLGVHAGTNVNATSITFDAGTLQVTAGGKLTLTSATVNAAGGIDLHANSMALGGAILQAGKALDLHVTKALSLAHATFSGSAVSASAGGNITNSGAAVTLDARSGALTLKSGGNLSLGGETLHVGGAAMLTAAGSLDLTNTTLIAGGAVTLQGATLAEDLAHLTAAGALTETGGSVDLTSATLKAGKALDLHATRGIKLANAVLTGSAVSASGAAISNGGSAASITAGAGGLKLKSKGVVALDGETLQVGTADATVSAAGNISLTGATLGAGSVHMTAGGSVDVSGIKLTASKTVQLVADKDIVLSGVNITANTFIADASGTIHNGGAPGSLKANGLALVAGKNISMTSTQISIGTGSVSSVHADALLLQELDALGIGPTSAVLNGSFIAGGSVALGDLSVTGHYLMFQGTSVAILGKVTAPTSGLLVQVVPFDTTAAIGVEDKAATTQTFNISNQGFFALFPGDTIAVGDDVESGAVFIGLNGGFTLADKTNLYFDTSGPITGLDLITSTGLVSSLENFVATANDSVVTVGEIDPTAGSTRTGLGDQTDKKHLGQNGDFGDQGQQGGTISNDTNGSGVCH